MTILTFHLEALKKLKSHRVPYSKVQNAYRAGHDSNDSKHVVILFSEDVVKLHDILRNIVSDRDVNFYVVFRRYLKEILS